MLVRLAASNPNSLSEKFRPIAGNAGAPARSSCEARMNLKIICAL